MQEYISRVELALWQSIRRCRYEYHIASSLEYHRDNRPNLGSVSPYSFQKKEHTIYLFRVLENRLILRRLRLIALSKCKIGDKAYSLREIDSQLCECRAYIAQFVVSGCPSFDQSSSLLIRGDAVGPLLANKMPPSASGGNHIILRLFVATNIGRDTSRPLVAQLYQ